MASKSATPPSENQLHNEHFYNNPQVAVLEAARVPGAGLEWATAVPAWTKTVAQAAASFGHIQRHILWETPPMRKKKIRV